ncbi:MAG: hypothetical protein M9933_12825 [Chitinophagaceae bacterium]|nr:hypothetical protein [Chitinophagaceae bacterium]
MSETKNGKQVFSLYEVARVSNILLPKATAAYWIKDERNKLNIIGITL